LWTIGHDSRSIEDFLALLKEHEIEVLVDILSFPTSKIEHFKREEVQQWLPKYGIEYVWLGRELGGYRHSGYEARMETQLFGRSVEKLLDLARLRPVCIMCMEKNPKNYHRRLLTADLERKGVKAIPILEKG